jgi:flagellar basal body rod protein FlgC
MVASPNVDLAGEAVEQAVARYSFAMNAAVVRTYSRMMESLLDITDRSTRPGSRYSSHA